MFCPFHSNISKEQHEMHLWSIQPLWKIWRIYSCNTRPHMSIHESHFSNVKLVLQHSKQGIAGEVPQQSLCLVLKPLRVYRKSSPYAVVKKSMGDQRGTKVSPWCKHCGSCGWWKGTSPYEAMLISEEIKSLALAVLKLCLSEGISK